MLYTNVITQSAFTLPYITHTLTHHTLMGVAGLTHQIC